MLAGLTGVYSQERIMTTDLGGTVKPGGHQADGLRSACSLIYTGIDIIEISRIAEVARRYPKRFLEKIYTRERGPTSRGRAPQLASRFAAKEAVMKALGTGVRGVSWREIEVVRPRPRPRDCSARQGSGEGSGNRHCPHGAKPLPLQGLRRGFCCSDYGWVRGSGEMKAVTAAQMRRLEQATVEAGVSLDELMENAGRVVGRRSCGQARKSRRVQGSCPGWPRQ